MGTDLNREFSIEESQMTGKQLKKCSMFLAKGEMQIKVNLRYRHTPVRIAKFNNVSDSSRWQGCGTRENFSIIGGSADLYSNYGNQYGSFSHQ